MKNSQSLCFLVLFLFTLSSNAIKIKLEKTTWTSITSTSIDSTTGVQVYFPSSKLSSTKVNELLSEIPKTEIKVASTDIIVVNTNLIFWFVVKKSTDTRTTLSTSSGLLGGIYEITKKESNNQISYELRKDNDKLNLLSNSDAMKFFGQYANIDGSTNPSLYWGLESCTDSSVTQNSGKPIDINEGGIYSDNGLKIEFEGTITNQLAVKDTKTGSFKQTAAVGNFKTETDTDNSDASGSAKFTLTWKIPADKSELSSQISVKPVTGTMKISQINWEMNYNAKTKTVNPLDPKSSIPVTYEAVSSPELMITNTTTSLANVDINKYFTNSCIKSLYNYEFKDTTKAFGVKTPPGRGQVACVGSPLHKISFICSYPNNDYLPKEAYETYSLALTETKSDSNRDIKLSYSLLGSSNLILTSNQASVFGVRFKIIDATPALAAR